MGLKKKNDNKQSQGTVDDLSSFKKDQLTALLIADSLEATFRPLTCELPKVLIPFNGVPILTYVLEFLKENNVKDVLIVTTNGREQLEEFIKNSKASFTKSLKIKFFEIFPPSASPFSFGDLMREVDGRGCDLGDDFLLMYADAICEFHLASLVEAHQSRKNCLMTKVFTPALPSEHNRTTYDDACVVFDDQTKEMISWDSLSDPSSKVVLDRELIERNSQSNEVRIRYDLLDAGVAVCSSRLLKVFSESFDLMYLRRDLVTDILTKPIKTESIFVYTLESKDSDGDLQHAMRLSDPRTFHAALMARMKRHTHSLACSRLPGQDRLVNDGRSVFIAKDVELCRNTDIGPLVTVLSGCHIGTGTKIRSSVIGKGCRIGNDVVMEGCVLFDGVEIGDKVVCKDSIVSWRTKIGEGVVVDSGCILGSDVIIAAGQRLKPLTKLTMFETVSGKEETMPKKSPTACKVHNELAKDKYNNSGESDISNYGSSEEGEEEEEEDEDKDGKNMESYKDNCGDEDKGLDRSGEDEELKNSGEYIYEKFRKISEDRLEKLMSQTTKSGITSQAVVGVDGVGVLYRPNANKNICVDQLSENFPSGSIGVDIRSRLKFRLPAMTIESDEETSSAGSSESGDEDGSCIIAETVGETKSKTGKDGASTGDNGFESEVAQFVVDGLEKPDIMHHKLLEIKSYRLATNRSDTDILTAAIPPILYKLKDNTLCFDTWQTKFTSCGATKLFDACFDDSSEDHHYAIFDGLLDFCLQESAETQNEVEREEGKSCLATSEALSFLLQLFARLEIVDDEFTLQWHQEKLQHITQMNDTCKRKSSILSLLCFDNLLEYVKWLKE